MRSKVEALGSDPSSWHLAAAVDRAIGLLREGDVDSVHLEHVTRDAHVSVRDELHAQLLATAMRALQSRLDHLSRAGPVTLRDARSMEILCARVLDDETEKPRIESVLDWIGPRLLLRDLLDLPPSRRRLLESLARRLRTRGGEIALQLPVARDQIMETVALGAPDERVAEPLERWLSANDSLIRWEPRPIGAHEEESAPFRRGANLCFTEGFASVPASDALVLRLVSSSRDEAETVAHEIVRAVRDHQDLSLDQITVALGELDPLFVDDLSSVLEEIGVPYRLERGQTPSRVPSVASFLRICEELTDGICRKDTLVHALTHSPCIASSVDGLLGEVEATVGLLLANLRRAVVPAGVEPVSSAGHVARDPLAEELARLWQSRSGYESAREDLYATLAKRVVEVRDALVEVATATTRAAALDAMECLVDVLGTKAGTQRDLSEILGMTDPERRRELLFRASSDIRGTDDLRSAIRAVREVSEVAELSAENVTIAGLLAEIRATLASLAPAGASASGAVTIDRIRRCVGRPTAVLIIAQCHEGLLPVRSGQDPLITASLRRALGRLDPERCPDNPRIRAAITVLAALDALGSCERRAVVVMRTMRDDGSRVAPGPLVVELAQRFGVTTPDVDLRSLRTLRLTSLPIRAEPWCRVPRDVSIRLAACGAALPGDPVALAAAQCASVEEARRVAFSRRLARELAAQHADTPEGFSWGLPQSAEVGLDGRLRPFDPISSPLALDAVEATLVSWQKELLGAYLSSAVAVCPMSATEVEAYARCHFRAWIEHGLGATRTVPTGRELDARQRGQLVHQALFHLYRLLPETAWNPAHPDHQESLSNAAKLADEALNMASASEGASPSVATSFATDPMRELDLDVLRSSLVDLLRWDLTHAVSSYGVDGPRRPVSLETPFGRLVLGSEGRGDELVIRGRIDRVDQLRRQDGEVLWLVLDYKRRANISMRSPPLLVTDLQLPIYALALRSLCLAGAASESRVDAAVVGYQRPVGMGKTAMMERNANPGPFGAWDDALGMAGPPETSPFALALVSLFNDRLRAGLVTPTGAEPYCARCALRPACRKPWLLSSVASEDRDDVENPGEAT